MIGGVFALCLLSQTAAAAPRWPSAELRYGGDAEGGAPFTFYDPDQPDRLIGFEVDIADELGRRMGAKPVFVQNAWDSLIPGLTRGDIDVVINGIEVTPERAQEVEFSRPYYVFQEELTVRATETAIHGLADLGGHKVGTLAGLLARQILEGTPGVKIVTFPDVIEPYQDLKLGRVDAVLLDVPIASYYAHGDKGVKTAGSPIGRGVYAGVVRKGDSARREALDAALGSMIDDGSLRKILEKWGLWNAAQAELTEGRALTDRFAATTAWEIFRSEGATSAGSDTQPAGPQVKRPDSFGRFFPPLLGAAGVTLMISVASFLLAVAGGLPLALARIYGPRPIQLLAVTYVEVVRGTPLLIQLLVLYYGLPHAGISFPAFTTAVLGLGMNYAAYEAEVYRAAILSVPAGQMEAALSLGMGRWQALAHVILPQAARIALPPSTNDFIALFKDSSLVSVITVVELTKTFQIYAASTYSYAELGAMTAGLYLAMSLPLAAAARRMERKLQASS